MNKKLFTMLSSLILLFSISMNAIADAEIKSTALIINNIRYEVEYLTSDSESYIPFEGAIDIYKATRDEILEFNQDRFIFHTSAVNEVGAVRSAISLFIHKYEIYFFNSLVLISPFVVHYSEYSDAWIINGAVQINGVNHRCVCIITSTDYVKNFIGDYLLMLNIDYYTPIKTTKINIAGEIVDVSYRTMFQESYVPYFGAIDIHNASANELKKLDIENYEIKFGPVQDEETAVKIAAKIFDELFDNCLKYEQPFEVFNSVKSNAWLIHGYIEIGSNIGVAEIAIDKNTGEILMLFHTR